MKHGRRNLGRRQTLALAIVMLPMLVIGPAMTGVTLLHDHGDGLHAHAVGMPQASFLSVESVLVDHHHHHGRSGGHHHHHGRSDGRHRPLALATLDARSDELSLDEDGPESNGRDGGLLLVVPRLVVAHFSSRARSASVPLRLPAWVPPSAEPAVSRTAPFRALKLKERVSLERGFAALLASSHAILI